MTMPPNHSSPSSPSTRRGSTSGRSGKRTKGELIAQTREQLTQLEAAQRRQQEARMRQLARNKQVQQTEQTEQTQPVGRPEQQGEQIPQPVPDARDRFTDLLLQAQVHARSAKALLRELPVALQADPDVDLALTLLTSVQFGLIDARHRHLAQTFTQAQPTDEAQTAHVDG